MLFFAGTPIFPKTAIFGHKIPFFRACRMKVPTLSFEMKLVPIVGHIIYIKIPKPHLATDLPPRVIQHPLDPI